MRLKACLQKIEQLPEANQLMKEIRKEGAIGFAVVENDVVSRFGAFWDWGERMICVNPSFHRDEGAMIGSILFEMQNAFVSRQFHELLEKAERGEIGRENYIRAVEEIEYHNSKRAASMAEAGINRGYFLDPRACTPTLILRSTFIIKKWEGMLSKSAPSTISRLLNRLLIKKALNCFWILD